jgi:hypothetical protein
MFTILLASSLIEDVGGKMLVAFLLLCWLISKFVKSNPSVGDAAKKAAANKAIDIIGKWLK